MKSETVTLLLVNLASIMERADEKLLPGVYKEVGAALHTDPTGLGSLTFFRSIVQSLCYPLAAYLASNHNRAHVIALGAFLWAAATFLVAISSTFFQVAVSRGLNGIGLAIVIPAIQSLVADSTDASNRGLAFGLLQLTAAVLLLVLPDDPSTAFMHGLALFILAFFASWDAAATNNPIFAEIVPEKSRTSIYALDRSFETILSSFAPTVVGILAQNVYGYKPIPKESSSSAEIETDRQNAASLAKALYTAIGIPAAICCFIYSFLYCTYPRDREHARMYALIESEMQKIEVDNSLSDKIDIDYEGLDDNNEKPSLL